MHLEGCKIEAACGFSYLAIGPFLIWQFIFIAVVIDDDDDNLGAALTPLVNTL